MSEAGAQRWPWNAHADDTTGADVYTPAWPLFGIDLQVTLHVESQRWEFSARGNGKLARQVRFGEGQVRHESPEEAMAAAERWFSAAFGRQLRALGWISPDAIDPSDDLSMFDYLPRALEYIGGGLRILTDSGALPRELSDAVLASPRLLEALRATRVKANPEQSSS